METRAATAWGYCRVSGRIQAQEGISLEVQRDQTQAYWMYALKPRGVLWGGWWEDPATSASIPLGNREAGGRMLTAAGKGDHLIFSKLDRGFRCPIDALSTIEICRSRGVALHFLDLHVDTSTPVGEVVVGVLAIFARFDRQRIRERVTEAKATLRAQGRATEHAPYGYRIAHGPDGAKRLVPDPEQRRHGQLALRLRDQGKSWEEILLYFQCRGMTTPRGKPYTMTALKDRAQKETSFIRYGKVVRRREDRPDIQAQSKGDTNE